MLAPVSLGIIHSNHGRRDQQRCGCPDTVSCAKWCLVERNVDRYTDKDHVKTQGEDTGEEDWVNDNPRRGLSQKKPVLTQSLA